MKTFDALCREIEALTPEQFDAALGACSMNILPVLEAIAPGEVALQSFRSFLISAAIADGKLDEAEFALLRPGLCKLFNQELTYEDAKLYTKELIKERKLLAQSVDFMTDMIGSVDESVKESIILASLMVCSVDGKVSAKEKKYIKQLIKE